MKRNVFQDGNGSGLVMIEGLGEYVPVAQLAELEQCIADQKRLTKELDIAMNGEDAAEQASLCDLVAQFQKVGPVSGLQAKAVWLQNELDHQKLIHLGFTNNTQIEGAKQSAGSFYPSTDNDNWIPVYMLAIHAHRCGPDSETFCHLLELEKRNRELEQERDQLKEIQFVSQCEEVDVIRCLKTLAYEHNHADVPRYQTLAKRVMDKYVERGAAAKASLAAHDAQVVERAACELFGGPYQMHKAVSEKLIDYANQLRQQTKG